MSRRSYVVTWVIHVMWWAWSIGWAVFYVWQWGNNPWYYSLLLCVFIALGIVMIRSFDRCRQLRYDMIQREATMQDDLRVAVANERWMDVDHTLARMKIWDVTPQTSVPPHPGPEDDSYWFPGPDRPDKLS